jgi:hypothetical protein
LFTVKAEAKPVFFTAIPKILEIIVARKNGFDIFRAPFDRNKRAGILAE